MSNTYALTNVIFKILLTGFYFIYRIELIQLIQNSIVADVNDNSIIEQFDEDLEENIEEEQGDQDDSLRQKTTAHNHFENDSIDTERQSHGDVIFLSDDEKTLINDNDEDNEECEYNNDDFYEEDDENSLNIGQTRAQFESENLFEFEIQQVLNSFPSNCNIRCTTNRKKYKQGTRKSLTFTNERMRDIERHNQILLRKIIEKGPHSTCPTLPRAESRLSRKSSATSVNSSVDTSSRISSATLNRRKQQQQIDYENQILRRKLESIHQKRRSFCWNSNF